MTNKQQAETPNTGSRCVAPNESSPCCLLISLEPRILPHPCNQSWDALLVCTRATCNDSQQAYSVKGQVGPPSHPRPPIRALYSPCRASPHCPFGLSSHPPLRSPQCPPPLPTHPSHQSLRLFPTYSVLTDATGTPPPSSQCAMPKPD